MKCSQIKDGPRRGGYASRLLGAVLALVLCGAAGDTDAATGTNAEEGRTLVVTSDSSAYCRNLSGMIEAHGALPRDVEELKAQGDGLCDEGHVRSGISRLRRALLALMPRNPQAREPAAP